MKIEQTDINKIKPYERNPRKISEAAIDKVATSLTEYGWQQPIVVDKNNVIIVGHTRMLAARKLKYDKVPVLVADQLSDDKVKAYRLADNRSGEEATWDFSFLGDEIGDLEGLDFDLSMTLFDDDEISKIMDLSLGEDEDEQEEDNVPGVNDKDVQTKLGDIWILGDHRVICGDSTAIADIDSLFKDKKADLILTDPPYGVNYEEKNEHLDKYRKGSSRENNFIHNDNIENYREFFANFMSIIPLNNKNIFYIFMSGQELHNVRLAFDDCDIKWGDYLVWLKNNHVLSRKDYNAKHEFIVYGWKGTHKFYGDNCCNTILEFNKPQKADLHPTMKPIPLIEEMIKTGSIRGMIVYDAFGGSGSTLMACENLGRKCFTIELSPNYCDVIVKRWQNQTKKDAVLESTGETFNSLIEEK